MPLHISSKLSMNYMTIRYDSVTAWLLIALAENIPMVLVGRALCGFGVGVASLALPVYLGETIQTEVRGTLGLMPTAFGNTGKCLTVKLNARVFFCCTYNE